MKNTILACIFKVNLKIGGLSLMSSTGNGTENTGSNPRSIPNQSQINPRSIPDPTQINPGSSADDSVSASPAVNEQEAFMFQRNFFLKIVNGFLKNTKIQFRFF